MSSPPRWIIVDDTNSAIQYSGTWTQSYDSDDLNILTGPPFQSTLHSVNSNASLSYTFSGSQVQVFGTVTSSGPTWACFIDGIQIQSVGLSNPPSNNWKICNSESENLSDGQHVLTINVSVLNKTDNFWLDEIRYVPSKSISLDNTAIYVDPLDASVIYEGNWEGFDLAPNRANRTQETNAKLTFDFVGISLTWFTILTTESSNQSTLSSWGTYAIDGGPTVTFLIPAQGIGWSAYNQILFQTERLLSHGHHHLEVINGGNGYTTPLSLQYLIIQNGRASKSVPIGAVVGGVLGGLIGVVGIILLLLFFRGWARKRRGRNAVLPSVPSSQPPLDSDGKSPLDE